MPQYFPVRPKPVIISSAMKSAPISLAMDLIAGRNSLGGMMLPAEPCIGSTMIAAISPADIILICLRATSAQAMPQRRILQPDGAAIAVGVGNDVRARNHGAHLVFEIRAHERKHAHGFAVESAPEAHELVFAGEALGQAKRGFDGFGAAGVKLGPVDVRSRAMLRDFLEELDARFGSEASDGSAFSTCVLDRFDDFRMAMAQAVDADSADDVDEGVAVDVRQRASSAFMNHDAGHCGELLMTGSQVFFFARAQLAAFRDLGLRFSRRLVSR